MTALFSGNVPACHPARLVFKPSSNVMNAKSISPALCLALLLAQCVCVNIVSLAMTTQTFLTLTYHQHLPSRVLCKTFGQCLHHSFRIVVIQKFSLLFSSSHA